MTEKKYKICCSVERGQRGISILNIIKIADALGVSASSLLSGLGGCNDQP